jgi:tRNA pseudouridine55 synthase
MSAIFPQMEMAFGANLAVLAWRKGRKWSGIGPHPIPFPHQKTERGQARRRTPREVAQKLYLCPQSTASLSIVILVKDQPLPDPFPLGALLLVDKPLAWTSFDVVNKVRHHLGKRLGNKKLKVGHAGTLDPLATGLLLICVGQYTKRIDTFQAERKTYTGTVTIGATTPSYDLEKAVDAVFPTDHVDDATLQAVIGQFTGPIQQVPPMYSAVKVDGKRLYKNARTGEEVELPHRPVEIFDLQISPLRSATTQVEAATLLGNKGTAIWQHPDHLGGLQADFQVVCSKGTYIRSLAYDLGAAVRSGGYLSRLCRTASGDFGVEDAWDLERFIEQCKVP